MCTDGEAPRAAGSRSHDRESTFARATGSGSDSGGNPSSGLEALRHLVLGGGRTADGLSSSFAMVKSEDKGMRFTRRGLLLGASSVALFPRSAGASVARGLTLGELVYESGHVLIGKSVDSFANWEQIGKRRAIVTYSLFH